MAQNQISAEALELFDSLMDATPEALHALPEYKAFPQGSFLCKLKCDPKEGQRELNGSPFMAVEFVLEDGGVESVGEGVDQSDVPNPGDTCSILFKLDDELGQGRLRNFLTALKVSMGRQDEEMKNSEILSAAHDSLVRAAFKAPRVKDDRKYANLIGLEFVG